MNSEIALLNALSSSCPPPRADASSSSAVAAASTAATRWWLPCRGDEAQAIDGFLRGRLSATTNTPVFDFLSSSFARLTDLRSRKSSAALTPELIAVYDTVSELIVSYTAICLQSPGMFAQPKDAEDEGPLRLLRPLRNDTLPPNFLTLLVARLEEDDALADVFLNLRSAPVDGVPNSARSIFEKLVEEASKVDITSAEYGCYRALHALIREKAVGKLFANQRADGLWQSCVVDGRGLPYFGRRRGDRSRP